jgi:NADH-quinone oxidoreductase subunit J
VFPLILFYVIGAVIVAAALLLVVHRNPVACAMFLVVTMLGLAGIFLLLGAHFIAAIQVIIYAGAIMVLFLFVVMLLNVENEALRLRNRFFSVSVGTALGVLLLAELLFLFRGLGEVGQSAPAVTPQGGAEAVGMVLFTKYLFAFEVASLLLLAALLGAVFIARREPKT